MDPEESFKAVRNAMKAHHEWFKRCLPLIASENIVSPAVREAIISDFGHRYAEGWPGERVYAGCKFIDEVELICIDLAKDLFRADFADVRATSGVVANLIAYTALTKPGDTMMAMPIPSGGHISHGPEYTKSGSFLGGTAGAVHGLNVEYFVFDRKELNLDVDESAKRIREVKPKLLLFGASVFLFPHPVKELGEVGREVGAKVAYDAAHVAGLIAGGYFQDPLREGADTVQMSTHKTLPGPQHGMVLAKKELGERIKQATFPGLTSNHHLHNVAGLAIALAEFKKFGKEYAGQIIKNSKALGQALYERGFKVLGEAKGFTESHTLLVDITNFKNKIGLGRDIEERLEKAGIILNRNLLPWDISEGRNYLNPGGIRLGTSEVTRLGMKESEMQVVADFIKRVVIDKEDPAKISLEVAEFRKDFQKVHYCFESELEAYEYVELH
ncbi:MAG: serine hydroxymethyltransferase [Candidatus Jordarchaeaceae archaeon]